MSRSLVGSSRMSTLGSVRSRRVSCRRRRSPPLRSLDARLLPTAGEAEPRRELAGADLLAAEGRPLLDVLDRLDDAPLLEALELAHLLGEEGDGDRLADLAPPARQGQLARQRAQQRRLAGAVDADDADPLARREAPGDAVEQEPLGRRVAEDARWRPRGRARPCRGARLANEASSTLLRGAGSSAMRAFAASMRNFGLLVRAGGPRRSQASSLRMRLARRSATTPARRSRSAFART